MSTFEKPQSPIYSKSNDAYIYPLTTEDQVILENGNRLSGINFLSVDKDGSNNGEPNPVNADTLGGISASEYATNDYVNQQVKKAAPRNLLDNSDFRNPVNQRGFVSGTAGEANYTIDRWWLQHVTNLHLYSDCIGLSGFWDVTQWIGSKITTGTTLTFAVMAKSEAPTGNVFVSINNTTDSHGTEIRENISNVDWKTIVGHWMADRDYDIGEVKFTLGINTGDELTTQIYYKCPVVYEGEYTIDTLPEYQPKGYENELLICKQYSPETGEYIGIPEVVNNFTTTEEGFVADARALKVLNEKFVVPNYSARTTLFSQTSVAGETPIYEHTMESDGYIYAYVNTNSSKAHPFMEFKIDNTLIYHYAKGPADTYTYRMSPLYPVKKGMQIYLRIGDYGVGGSGLMLFFIPVML